MRERERERERARESVCVNKRCVYERDRERECVCVNVQWLSSAAALMPPYRHTQSHTHTKKDTETETDTNRHRHRHRHSCRHRHRLLEHGSGDFEGGRGGEEGLGLGCKNMKASKFDGCVMAE